MVDDDRRSSWKSRCTSHSSAKHYSTRSALKTIKRVSGRLEIFQFVTQKLSRPILGSNDTNELRRLPGPGAINMIPANLEELVEMVKRSLNLASLAKCRHAGANFPALPELGSLLALRLRTREDRGGSNHVREEVVEAWKETILSLLR